jgi:hypothetical protein
LTVDAIIATELSIGERVVAVVGAGFDHRNLFALDPSFGVSPIVAETPKVENRPFVLGSVGVVFNPAELRRDRKHSLGLEARFYGESSAQRDVMVHLVGAYQKVFAFGWNDFRISSNDLLIFGDVVFPEERPLSADYLRGPFSTVFARKVGNLSLDLRYSLVRDVFKVGVFHDLALFGAINRNDDSEKLRIADAFGPSLHALLIDTFQLDAYFGFGFSAEEAFDFGIYLAIKQVF